MSCDNRKERSVHAVSFDIIGGKDVMPVGAFVGPFSRNDSDKKDYPEFVNEAFFKKCAACGINLFVYPHEYADVAPESVDKALRLCEKYHIGYFAMHRYFTHVFMGQESADKEKIARILRKFSEYPAFVGIHTKDEPVTPQFGGLGAINDAFYELAEEGKHTYSNLYPRYYWDIPYGGRGGENCTYEEYVDRYIRETHPRFLSYDHYVYETFNGSYRTNTDDYFTNLSVIRRKAEEHGIPFWVFVQAGGHWNDRGEEIPVITHFPKEGEFRWNVCTQLAYGAKGMQYFPLIQDIKFAKSEHGVQDFGRNGLFAANGNVNKWYRYAKEANAHIRCISEVLMNAANEGVIASGISAAEIGDKPEIIKEGKYFELERVFGDAVVGCFNYRGRTALYAVNGLRRRSGEVSLAFGGTQRFRIVQGTQVSFGEGERIALSLRPGEGALVVLE